MGGSTTIRVDRATHAELRRLAAEEHVTITEVVLRAVRALRQERMGRELARDLTDEENAWLDADLG